MHPILVWLQILSAILFFGFILRWVTSPTKYRVALEEIRCNTEADTEGGFAGGYAGHLAELNGRARAALGMPPAAPEVGGILLCVRCGNETENLYAEGRPSPYMICATCLGRSFGAENGRSS